MTRTTVAVGEDAMEGSLDEITSRFERSVLTQLYRNYPSIAQTGKTPGRFAYRDCQ
ncbi:hypothetical protein OIU92_29100 [Escherichia coli]|nr:hypothetical protein [Escherichia coli]